MGYRAFGKGARAGGRRRAPSLASLFGPLVSSRAGGIPVQAGPPDPCRIRLEAQDTALSRRRSPVRIRYAVPNLSVYVQPGQDATRLNPYLNPYRGRRARARTRDERGWP